MTDEEMQEICDSFKTRIRNKDRITLEDDYQAKLKEIKEIGEFIITLSSHLCNKNIILPCALYCVPTQILDSLGLTVGSIVSCCEFGCIADANSLLRKYKDDIFFFLYLIVYSRYGREASYRHSEIIKKMEANVRKWLKNNLSNLYIGMVLKDISQFSEIKEAVIKYNMKSYFDKLTTRLNNFVHSNGIKYYNQDITRCESEELLKMINPLLVDMRYITVSFLFLLTLCYPILISSTEYITYLEFGLTPPAGSQYLVAKFIYDFFEENLHLIDESCIEYLRDNTSMIFD